MDLSKLPKLSQSPEPASAPLADSPAAKPPALRLSVVDVGLDILVCLGLGAVFMMLGPSFGGWLIAQARGVRYETGVIWSPGTPKEGQPVDLFELQGGTGWLHMGLWSLGACLLLAGVLLLCVIVLPRGGRAVLILVVLVCVAGAAANIVAIVMQVQAGFTQPIISVIAVLAGAMCAFFPGRHLVDMRPRA